MILPSGWLALCQYHDRRLLMLGLGPRGGLGLGLGGGGLQGSAGGGVAGGGRCHEGVAGLVADLGALLAEVG